MELTAILESLIFASDKPVTLRQLKSITGTPSKQLKEALGDLQQHYCERGIQLSESNNGYLFRTHPDASNWVRKLLAGKPQRLTRPMLESLAIVAYRQPVTRPEVEEIRGVDCGGTLRVLLERDLIRIVGKKEEPGRPLLYGTTKFFLQFFQLKNLKDLPTLKEFTELSAEHSEQLDEKFPGAPPAEQSAAGAPQRAIEDDGEDTQAAQTTEGDGQAETLQQGPADQTEPAEQSATSDTEQPRSTTDDAEPEAKDAQRSAVSQQATPPPPANDPDDEKLLEALDSAIDRADGVLKRPPLGVKPSSSEQ